MKKALITITFIITAIVLCVTSSAVNIDEIFDAETFTSEDTTLPYRIYVPSDYGESESYPLVLFLHGAGERGNDNESQLKNALPTLFERADGLMKKSIVIAPQCPSDNQWVDTPWTDGNYSVDEIPESNELAAVVELVKSTCDKYSIDKARVYVIGISMGGFGTWDLIMRHNDIFAAAIPICGGADPTKAEKLVNTPVYTFHGTDDTSVPYEGTAEMVEAIEDLGGRLINFITYDGEGHGIWDTACAEDGLLEWLFSQKLSDRYPEMFAPEETAAETETDTVAETEAAVTNAPETGEKATDVISDETEKTVHKTSENGLSPVVVGVLVAGVVIVLGLMTFIIKSGKAKKK